MTNEQINRAVAEKVLGWQPMPAGDYGDMWRRPDGRLDVLRNWCTDPAAWGSLCVWMESAPAHESVSITYIRATQRWSVSVHRDKATYIARDAQPGRALCLAALKAYGVGE